MRPLSFLAVLAALTGAVLVGCGIGDDDDSSDSEMTAPPVPETVRYAALGDSLATGAGAETSYVADYAAWLRSETGSAVEVTNLAVAGWTSRDLLDALTGDPEMRAAVAAAHVLTWDIGGNDMLAALAAFLQGTCGGIDGQDCVRDAVDTAVDNGDAVLDELLRLRDGESDGLRTIGLYLPFMEDPRVAPYLDELRPYLDEFNERLTRSAQERGVEVADVADAFHGADGDRDPVARGLISEDGLHPSDRGHQVIAEHIAALGLELRISR